MTVCILYHPNSEFSRTVEEYAHDFEKERNESIELVSLESIKGAEMAKLYDVVEYPAILAISTDGQLQKLWQGKTMPLKDEVAGYLEAGGDTRVGSK